MTKNYKKDISSITTPIKFHLPDGSTIPFENSAKAQQWFNKNYGNGYSMVEYTPTQGDSEHPVQLQEITVTAQAPKSKSTPSAKTGVDMYIGRNYDPEFNKRYYGMSHLDALLGKVRVENMRKADPQVIKNFRDGSNAAAAFFAAPLAAYGAGEYVLPWVAQNVAPYLSARGWLAATQAAGNTPAWLTPTSATAIDAALAGGTTGVSVNDMIQNGPTVGNVLGTTAGVVGLGAEAAPTIMEGYTTAARYLKNARLATAMNQSAKHFKLHPYFNFQVPIEDGYLYHTHSNAANGFVKNGTRYNRQYSPGAVHIKDGKYASSRMYSDDSDLDRIWWDKKGHNSGDNVYVMKEDVMPTYKISDPESKADPYRGLYFNSYRTTKRPDVNNVVKFTHDPIYGYVAYSPYRKYTTNRMSLNELFNTPTKTITKGSRSAIFDFDRDNEFYDPDNFTSIEGLLAKKSHIQEGKNIISDYGEPELNTVSFQGGQEYPIVMTTLDQNSPMVRPAVEYFNTQVKPRFRNFGLNVKNPFEISSLLYGYDMPYYTVKNGTATMHLPPSIGGGAADNVALVFTKAQNPKSTWVHEGASHLTDNHIPKTISDQYQSIATIPELLKQKGFKWNTPDSGMWEEARAALNQVRAQMLKDGLDLNNLSDDVILDYLQSINSSYGSDYSRIANNLSGKDKSEYVDKIRKSLIHLPVVGGFIIGNKEQFKLGGTLNPVEKFKKQRKRYIK